MNFRRKGWQKYMKKRIVFELAAGVLMLVSALYGVIRMRIIRIFGGTIWYLGYL